MKHFWLFLSTNYKDALACYIWTLNWKLLVILKSLLSINGIKLSIILSSLLVADANIH